MLINGLILFVVIVFIYLAFQVIMSIAESLYMDSTSGQDSFGLWNFSNAWGSNRTARINDEFNLFTWALTGVAIVCVVFLLVLGSGQDESPDSTAVPVPAQTPAPSSIVHEHVRTETKSQSHKTSLETKAKTLHHTSSKIHHHGAGKATTKP